MTEAKVPISTFLTERVLNPVFDTSETGDVILIEALDVNPGDVFELLFEKASARWRHGVWLGIDGTINIESMAHDSFSIWMDTAPERVKIEIVEGVRLFLYNIWDRGFGRNSQAHTSGMISTTTAGCRRYRCQDINPAPQFDDLTFSIARLKPAET